MIGQMSFSEHLNRELGIFRFGAPFICSLAAGILSFCAIVVFYADSDKAYLLSLSPHISTLVETQDRPELQRFISSVAQQKGSEIHVLQHGKVLASSSKLGDIGLVLESERRIWSLKGSYLSSSGLVTAANVERPNGPTTSAVVQIAMPISSVVRPVSIVVILSFVIFFFFVRTLALNMIRKAQLAIAPIKDLDSAISDLQNFESQVALRPVQIHELDRIQRTISDTRQRLLTANEALASSKAKVMLVDAYEHLLHDLRTPVAAIKHWSKIVDSADYSEDVKAEGRARVADLAEQILRQVSAARSHLELKIEIGSPSDIRSCVFQAAADARFAIAKDKQVSVVHDVPSGPIFLGHDPAMLGRAVSNLVSNAIEAANEMVDVRISKRADQVHIEISDDGTGLEADQVSLFLQGRGKSTKANRNGIGLASANHIVNAHGGRLIYRPSSTGGACFEIRLAGSHE